MKRTIDFHDIIVATLSSKTTVDEKIEINFPSGVDDSGDKIVVGKTFAE